MDLPKIITELMSAGVTQGEIAECMECTQATVSRYKSGEIRRCSYQAGTALVELHLLRVAQKPRRRAEARARAS